MNTIVPLIKELERVYDELAKKLEIKFDRPIITIQTKGGQKQTKGWYWDKKWEYNKQEIGEINICAEDLNKNPIETLVHEMAHYSNACEGVEDCNSQSYHNKNFKTKAELYGLNVEKLGRHGWALTKITPKLESILKEIKIDYKIFELFRKENIRISAPTKMKKYNCGCTIIRCATALEAKCVKCNNLFNLEEIK